GAALTPEDAAEGFLRIANEHMAEAIKKISIQRGYDPARYALVAFGGAGGQHACAVADAVGVETVLLHPLAGVLSAWGMGLADVRAIVEETVERKLGDTGDLEARRIDLAQRAAQTLMAQSIDAVDVRISANLKYEGADSTLAVPYGDA